METYLYRITQCNTIRVKIDIRLPVMNGIILTRRLSTASHPEVQIQSQGSPCGTCDGQIDSEAGFSQEYFRFSPLIDLFWTHLPWRSSSEAEARTARDSNSFLHSFPQWTPKTASHMLFRALRKVTVPQEHGALTEHHAMKAYWGVEDTALRIVLGGEWSASRPGRFTPRERAPGTPWIGGWVGPRAGLGAVAKRKIPRPCRDSNHRSSSS
jgi:hypothetical protein